MELIDKDDILEKIKTLKLIWDGISCEYAVAQRRAYDDVLAIINTSKVIDLEESLSYLDRDIKEFITTEEFENDPAGHYWAIAKHAFLLGLKM